MGEADIYGELTADGTRIVLIAEGNDFSVARAAKLLQLMTPKLSATEPRGAMQLPLSWPAVVQLAATYGPHWHPQPRLVEWIAGEIDKRMGVPPLEPVTNAAGLTPRPYQLDGAAMIAATGRCLIFDEPGPQPTDTLILTPNGWSTLGALRPGEAVYNLYGQPTLVKRIKFFGTRDVFRVTFNDRTSTLATADHRWQVYTRNRRKRWMSGASGGNPLVISTRELQETGLHHDDKAARYYLPQQPTVYYPLRNTAINAYAYGALLGDGTLGRQDLRFTSPDWPVIDEVTRAARNLDTTYRYRDNSGCVEVAFWRNGGLRDALARYDALHYAADKYIHHHFMFNHEAVRRDVLAGLLDTDGSVTPTGANIEFSSASPRLSEGVAWLARSLGAVVTEAGPSPAGYTKDGEHVECLPRHRLLIRFPADGPNPFYSPRKAEVWEAAAKSIQRRLPPRTFQSIEPAGHAEVCCIELDTDDNNARVYLTDEALIPTHNTGKTATTILGLTMLHDAGDGMRGITPTLIICPASVVDPWLDQWQMWSPYFKAIAWRGTPAQRRELLGTADVYVASYETTRIDTIGGERPSAKYNPLLQLKPRTVVTDEIHQIKNAGTKRSRAVRKLAALAENFVGLSGTPITHHPGNLWPALYCLDPPAWPSRERMIERYCRTLPSDYGAPTILGLKPEVEPEFRRTMLGQHRRVAKADVLQQLPPKVYTTRTVELPDEYRKVYDKVEEEMLGEMPDTGDELSPMDVLSQMTALYHIASAAADVETTWEDVEDPATGLPMKKRHQNITLRFPSWKVDALMEVLDERPGRPVVVFAPSRQLIELAGREANFKGYKVGYVTGGQKAAERTQYINDFQAGKLDLICVTTGAGGVGITLTKADTCVFLQRPWSLVESIQCEDRCHRLGSEIHESIEVIDIVAKDTIDSRVRAVLKERAGQLADLVKDQRIVTELLGGSKRKKAAA